MAIYFAASFFSENSSKSYTMLAFLPVIVHIVGNKKYRKWIPGGVVFLAVFYLGVVAPAVNNSRTLHGKDSYHKIVRSFYSSSPFYSDRPFLLSMQDQLDQFMRRVFEMPPVAGFMVNEVKRYGFRLGDTMNNLYYAFIPRIVWHGKPSVSRGAWFTTYLRMAPREAEATTSTGMTIVGEWYWNFGAIGVVAGMFLTGLLLSGLWRMAGSYPIHQPANMLLYVAIIVNVLNLPDATSPLVSNIALYLLFGSLIYLHKFAQKMATFARPRNIQPRVMTASNHF
jgi:hypothetical protein